MGASESRSQQEADDDGTTPQDYYTILEVDENASADEIRVSQSLATTGKGIRILFFSRRNGNASLRKSSS
jgi:hypothetical protein